MTDNHDIEVRITYISNYATNYYLCRLFVDGKLVYEWECGSRRSANRSAKRRIKKYNKGWRPNPVPTDTWTVKL